MPKLKKNKGFSIVEMLASIAIFTIITTVVLVGHSKFSGGLLIENLAYDIALSIRKAQVFGLSVREFGAGDSEFDVGYGMHFDSASDDLYIFFADKQAPKYIGYEIGYDDATENIEIITLGKGNKISKICGALQGGVEKCSNDADGAITFIDIIFKRPNPEAIIKSNIQNDVYASAKITIQSPKGTTFDINTLTTGQISVEK